jgi:hypothetical protein
MTTRTEQIAAGICLIALALYLLDEATGGLLSPLVLLLAVLGIISLVAMLLHGYE